MKALGAVLVVVTAIYSTSALAVCRTDYDLRNPIEIIPLSLPDGCFARIRKPENAFLDALGDTASRRPSHAEIRKRDIVCIGEKIVINDDIYTNGGDIVVFASSFEINGVIDTRVYSSSDSFKKVLPGNPAAQTRPLSDMCAYPYPAQTALMYDFYYSDCVDCIHVGKNGLAPRMPDGAIVPYIGEIKGTVPRLEGVPAPGWGELNRAALKSGTAKIFHNSFNPLSAIPEVKNYSFPCEAPFNEEQVSYARIKVFGLYGGRGGPGSAPTCTIVPGAKFSCAESGFLLTGASGSGGPGGDAGNVVLEHFSLQDGADFQEFAYTTIAKASGGVSGVVESYLSPTTAGLYVATGSVCDFVRPDRRVKSFPPVDDGRAGITEINQPTSSEAFRDFLMEVISLDAGSRYDFLYAFDRGLLAATDKLTFVDHVVVEMSKVVASRQKDLLEGTISRIRDGGISQGVAAPSAFNEINRSALIGFNIPAPIDAILSELEALQFTVDTDRMYSYLEKSGGLFNLKHRQPDLFQILDSIKTIVFSTGVSVSAIQESLRVTDEKAKIDALKASAANVSSQVSSLESTIGQMEAILAQKESFLESLQPMIDFFKSAGSMIASFASGNYIAAVGAAADLYSGIDEGNDEASANKKKFLDASNAIPELKKEAQKAKIILFNINSRVAREVNASVAAARANIIGHFGDKTQLTLKQSEAVMAFEELYRWIVVSYLIDPNRDVDVLASRLSSLDQFVAGDKWETVTFSFGDIDGNRCIADGGTCQTVKSTKKGSVMEVAFVTAGGAAITLPAYVLNAADAEFKLSNFGFRLEEKVPQ